MGTLPRTGTVEVVVDASPEQVWDLLTDIARTGDWSHETRGGSWIGGATGPVPGARFRGHNRYGQRGAKWTRTCEVEQSERPSVFAWRTVPTRLFPDSTRWRVEIAPVENGTRVVQHFDVVHINPFADRLFYAMLPAHRDRRAALADDLRRLGEVAAREPLSAP